MVAVATGATSSVVAATALGNGRKLARTSNGVLWALFWDGGTGASNEPIELRYSTDNGATWTFGGGFGFVSTGNTHHPYAALFIDVDDYAHVVYKDRSDGEVYYRRGTPNAARTAYTWTSNFQTGLGTGCTHPDIVAHREGTGWRAHIVASYAGTHAQYKMITITSAGGLTAGTSVNVSDSHPNGLPTFPSIDFHHTGDGKTVQGGTPHLYVVWSGGNNAPGHGVKFRRAVYASGAWSWPNAPISLSDAEYVAGVTDWLNCLFDGTRVLVPGSCSGGNNPMILHERDAADTTTTLRNLRGQATTEGALHGSATRDSNGNVYYIGRAAGSNTLQRYTWVRADGVLSAPTVLDSTISSTPYASAKRDAAGGRVDWIYTDGTASPYPITYDALVLNVAPNAPGLVSPVGGAVIDRTQPLTLDWTFSDPDSGDTQSAADVQYRPAGTATWTLLQLVQSTTAHTLAGGALAAGDYEWQVRTADAAGAFGPWSASEFFTAANPPNAPTIVTPVDGATVPETVTVEWSYPTQAGYQVRRVADNAGVPDPATVYSDTGEVASTTARLRTVTFDTNNRHEHVQVRVRDANGLLSTWASRRVLAAYTRPLTPHLAPVADNAGVAVTLGVTSDPPNLMPTDAAASFEDGTTGGWASDTGAVSNAAGGTHGSRRLAVPMPLDAAWNAYLAAAARVPMGAGVAVTAALDLVASASRPGRVSLYYFDSAGTVLGATHTAIASIPSAAPARYAVTGTTPAGTASVSPAVDNNSAIGPAGTLYLDAVQVEKASAASPFHLPSTPAWVSLDVWRRLVGGVAERLRARVAPAASYRDKTPGAGGAAYEYQVVAYGDNGTSSTSPWTT